MSEWKFGWQWKRYPPIAYYDSLPKFKLKGHYMNTYDEMSEPRRRAIVEKLLAYMAEKYPDLKPGLYAEPAWRDVLDAVRAAKRPTWTADFARGEAAAAFIMRNGTARLRVERTIGDGGSSDVLKAARLLAEAFQREEDAK